MDTHGHRMDCQTCVSPHLLEHQGQPCTRPRICKALQREYPANPRCCQKCSAREQDGFILLMSGRFLEPSAISAADSVARQALEAALLGASACHVCKNIFWLEWVAHHGSAKEGALHIQNPALHGAWQGSPCSCRSFEVLERGS